MLRHRWASVLSYRLRPPPRLHSTLPYWGPFTPFGQSVQGPSGFDSYSHLPFQNPANPFLSLFPSLVFTLPFFSRAYRTTDASGFLRPLLPGFAQICPKYLFLGFICSKYPFLGFICPKYPFVRCICSKYPFFGVYLPKIPLFRVYLPKLPLFEAHLLKIPLFMGFICQKYPFFWVYLP